MLKKEVFVWRANHRFKLLEIALPTFIFLIIAVMHWAVPITTIPYNNTTPHFA